MERLFHWKCRSSLRPHPLSAGTARRSGCAAVHDDRTYASIPNGGFPSDQQRLRHAHAHQHLSERGVETVEIVRSEGIVRRRTRALKNDGETRSSSPTNSVIQHHVALRQAPNLDPSAISAEDRVPRCRHSQIVIHDDGALL